MLGAISEEIGGHGALILRNNGGTFSQIKSEGNSSLMGGNVGIGIKDPIDKLHIWGGTNGILLEAPLGGGVSQQGVFLKGDNNVYSSFQRWWSNASFMAQNLVLRDGNWSRANATRSLMFSMRDTSSTETFAWSSWTGASAPYTANYLMRLQDDGHLYIDGSYHCNGADYAEYFYTEDAKIKPGELVQAAISPDSVEKSISNANILGIVSTNPGVVGSLPKGEQKEQTPIDETALLPNGEEQAPADDYYTRLEKDPHWKPIGLLGKAPVIVVSINGDLNMNDFVSASQIPGIGMKATKSGFVVGQALESSTDWNKDNCQAVADYDSISWPEDDGSNPAKPCFQVLVSSFSPEIQSELQKEYQLLNNDYLYIGKLMLFIRPSFYSQDVFLSDMNGLELLRENQGYSLRDGLGKIIDRIGAFAEIMAAKIRVGTLEAKEIIIDGINILERLNEQQKKIEKLEERIEFLENR